MVQLFLAVAPQSPMKRVQQAMALAGCGLDGCRHAARKPGGKRQLLLVDGAELAALEVAPGLMKENVVISGIPLESFPPGQRLRVGEALIELTEQCVPCHKLELIRPGLLQQSFGRRGQLGRVIKGGVIREGDEVQVLEVNPMAPKRIQPKLP